MHEPQAKANLLTKTLCSGRGSDARLSSHCPCKTREWHQNVGCGGDGYDVTSKPCAECGINTCDECRIHVVYQVFMQDPGLDNRRWWAGYFFTGPTAFAIHPPKGTDADDSIWHLPADLMKPHHDQGRFHVPLHVSAMADPEPLDRILDINLGKHHITPVGRIAIPYEGDNLVMFFQIVAQGRRELVCEPCFEEHQADGNFKPCACTMRNRFLDRWVCVPCYEKESSADAELMKRYLPEKYTGHIHSRLCRCDRKITCGDTYKVVCNWCHGQVDSNLTEPDEDDEVAQTFVNTEDDEDNAVATPPNLVPNMVGCAENKDGTVSAFFNGERYSGERLGYGLLARHAIASGKQLPCTCCTCPGMACQHSHNHGHGESDGADESDDDDEDFYADWEDMDEGDDENPDDGYDGGGDYSEMDFDGESDPGDDLPDLVEQ
jgi:hypothetical protein